MYSRPWWSLTGPPYPWTASGSALLRLCIKGCCGLCQVVASRPQTADVRVARQGRIERVSCQRICTGFWWFL